MEATGLTIGDVAKLLGVPVHRVRQWTDSGRLTATRTDTGHRRYDPSAIDAFIAAARAERGTS